MNEADQRQNSKYFLDIVNQFPTILNCGSANSYYNSVLNTNLFAFKSIENRYNTLNSVSNSALSQFSELIDSQQVIFNNINNRIDYLSQNAIEEFSADSLIIDYLSDNNNLSISISNILSQVNDSVSLNYIDSTLDLISPNTYLDSIELKLWMLRVNKFKGINFTTAELNFISEYSSKCFEEFKPYSIWANSLLDLDNRKETTFSDCTSSVSNNDKLFLVNTSIASNSLILFQSSDEIQEVELFNIQAQLLSRSILKSKFGEIKVPNNFKGIIIYKALSVNSKISVGKIFIF